MQKQLDDGLILRSLSEGHASDRERLPQLYADVNGEHDDEAGKVAIKRWTDELMSGHPTVTADDIFVVVDAAQDERVVSATLLIPQTWRYEDIPLAVGRPELVATYAEYRGRGLVRALFEAVHERSAALGHQLQVITGIPHFYRKFGYTMAVDLADHATYPLYNLAEPKPDHKPAFTLRPAVVDDIPDLMNMASYLARERLLTEMHPAAVWHYEIAGRDPNSAQYLVYLMIVNADGEGVGYLELFKYLWDKNVLRCSGYVVGEESSYLETFEDVMRGVKQWATATYGECPAVMVFGAGIHEALDHLIDRITGGFVHRQEYLWYLRVPEMIPFLWHIRPVLERRLAGSGANRYSGELKIGFYDLTGISLTFERGQMTEINPISGKDGYDISFPWDLFWNVVFGHHHYDDIRSILPEVWASAKAAVLFDALFPQKKSWLKGLS